MFSFVGFQIENKIHLGIESLLDPTNNAVYTPDFRLLKRLAPGLTGTYHMMSECEEIMSGALSDCSITEITFSSNMTHICSNAFFYCAVKQINLTGIVCENKAFQEAGLESVVIPGEWRVTPEYIFGGCDRLKWAEIEEGIVEIGYGTFCNSKLSEGVRWADSIEKIGDCAFQYSKIPDMGLPDKNLKIIGKKAFESCLSITEIIIPACVRLIDDYAYSTCSGARRAILESCNTHWTPISFFSIYEYLQPTCIATRYFTPDTSYYRGEDVLMELFQHSCYSIVVLSGLF